MKILGWIFILIGLVDFVLSFIGLNLTPFFPNALSKFTPIVFGFIGGLLIKNAAKQKESSNKKKLEIFNIFKTKIIDSFISNRILSLQLEIKLTQNYFLLMVAELYHFLR